MATRRSAASLRAFSTGSTSSSSATVTTVTSDILSAPPKWLNRWFQVWLDESGTREILELKEQVSQSSQKFDEKQRQVVEARNGLENALKAWEDSQSQHTRLLQVRDKWSPTQAQDFATLVQTEVRIRNDLEQAKQNLSEQESQQASAQMEYMNDLRRRYHEEQIWQDKWRVMSTFGTWGLIILNSFVFLISQYLYRTRETNRIKEIESLLHQTLSSNTSTLEAIQEQQEYQQSQFEQHTNNTAKAAEEKATDLSADSVSIEPESSPNEAFVEVSISGPTSWKERLARMVPRQEAFEIKSLRNSVIAAWGDIQQKLKSRSFQEVDVPSAVLGASVTGLAWIAAVALSSKKSGQ